jgi:hypothetical protein
MVGISIWLHPPAAGHTCPMPMDGWSPSAGSHVVHLLSAYQALSGPRVSFLNSTQEFCGCGLWHS